MAPVASVAASVVGNEPAGAYRRLRFAAPAVAASAQPGQFVALSVGGDQSSMLLRRSFSIHRADQETGEVELVVAAHGPGTVWLAGLPPGAVTGLAGPLGTPFPVPDDPGPSVLVGGGYGSAPLFWLAERLRAAGGAGARAGGIRAGSTRVEVVLGAASADRLFGVEVAGRVADGVWVTTDDGSLGTRGWVSDVLPHAMERSGARQVYACGPMGMLRAVTEVAERHGAAAHVAVEEAMACGVGICWTCVIPVTGRDGRSRMARSCLDGPVFDGSMVRWDAFEDGWCRVPADAAGAPVAGGH